MDSNKQSKIQVIIRKRPLTTKEVNKKYEDIIDIKSYDTLHIKEKKTKVDLTKYTEKHQFTFDAVYGEDHDNQYIYIDVVQPLISAAFEKSKVTCFAYGQTGSGKTWTMMGSNNGKVDGLYNLAAKDLFERLKNQEYSYLRVGVSFYEIYCGKAYDLLNSREYCHIRVDKKEKVHVVGLTEKIVPNIESLVQLINQGLGQRIVGKTGMNENSSRSHAILQINLRNVETGGKHGSLSFIDLAGSERGSDVKGNNAKTRQDGAEINKSLLALKECIRALDLAKKHLPFRGSKLTLVLKDSFIGKCQTVMIGNISPSIDSCENTLNTLRYADRVKELKEGSGKQHQDKNELMLARDKNKSTIIEYEKPKIDGHLVFEEYNIADKGKKNKNQEQQPIFGKEKTVSSDSLPQEEEQDEESDLEMDESIKSDNSIKRQVQGRNQLKANDKQSKNQIRSQRKSRDRKSDLLYEESQQKPKKGNNFLKSNDNNFSNTVGGGGKTFLAKKKQPKMPSSQKQNIRQQKSQNMFNGKGSDLNQTMIQQYKQHVNNLVSVMRSDLRNSQKMEKDQNEFDNCFKKVLRNLDEKISEINQLKKDIQSFKQAQAEQDSDSRRSFSENEDPFF